MILGGGVLLASAFVVSLFAPHVPGTAGPGVDRVGFPQTYRSEFQALRSSFKAQKAKVATTYANTRAASVTEPGQLPYPNGSVFVFEWTEPVKDEMGTVVVEPEGHHQKGQVTRIDVMRREAGYGDVYGEDRAGEWEFASYLPDGRSMADEAELRQCAQCHAKAATRDYVFRGRFLPIGNQ